MCLQKLDSGAECGWIIGRHYKPSDTIVHHLRETSDVRTDSRCAARHSLDQCLAEQLGNPVPFSEDRCVDAWQDDTKGALIGFDDLSVGKVLMQAHLLSPRQPLH